MTPGMFNGIKVVIMPPVPRFTLASHVPVTEEFRREFNVWAAGFFGYHDPLPPVFSSWQNTLYISERDYQRVKAAAAACGHDDRIMQEMIYGREHGGRP